MGLSEGREAAALFDLDGVLFDTEPQYSRFWEAMGAAYHPEVEHFEDVIKGQTLVRIFDRWFAGRGDVRRRIAGELEDLERNMAYDYVPGGEDFLRGLREAGVRTAVVTSSNGDKMRNVYRAHPEFRQYFDRVLTAESFSRSKPEPDCYLLGAGLLGLPATRCVVFEDSFNGLRAGRAAGMKVVGLSTTNAPERIRDLCDRVIPDFRDFDVEKLLEMLARTGDND